MKLEVERKAVNGLMMVFVLILAAALDIYAFIGAIRNEIPAQAIGAAVVMLLLITAAAGLFTVQPNQARVLMLFGKYKGSVKTPGLCWANPFYIKKAISLRVRNFETAKLKVNDKASNPIEIGAIVVWQVIDSAEALFEVDNYEDYVRVQSESAVRTLASSYPYDAHKDGERSLSHNASEISDQLAGEAQ